jgi:uncharacterized protein YjiS (DUF1127 family)
MASSRRAILIAGLSASRECGVPQRLFWGTRLWHWCAWCSSRSRQRAALWRLDDRLLDDIGVTRQQANAEAAKPLWE